MVYCSPEALGAQFAFQRLSSILVSNKVPPTLETKNDCKEIGEMAIPQGLRKGENSS